MSEQIIFGPEAAKQIAEAVRGERRRLRNPDAGHRRQTAINEVELLQGFLAGDLDAATNATNGQTTATLNVWYRDAASGALVDGGRTIEVTNRDKDFAACAGDYLVVYWLEGEWRPHSRLGVSSCDDGSGSGCTLSFAIDPESIVGFDPSKRQQLGHREGCWEWIEVAPCDPDESGAAPEFGGQTSWYWDGANWGILQNECQEGFVAVEPTSPGTVEGEIQTTDCEAL